MPASTVAIFDGVNQPRLIVEWAPGGGDSYSATALKLGGSVGLGTATLGGITWVDITTDVKGVTIPPGNAGETESFTPGTFDITLYDDRADYNPLNLGGAYILNRLTANQRGLETGATTGWQAGLNTTIAPSAVQAYEGVWSLAMTKTVGTGTLYAQTPSAGGPFIPSSSPCRVFARFRANTTGRTCRARLAFHTVSDVYIPGADLLSANVTDNSGGWVTAEVTGLSPAQDTHIAMELQVVGAVVGETHYADDMWVIAGSLVDLDVPVRVRAEWPLGTFFTLATGKLNNIVPDLAPPRPTVTLKCAQGVVDLGGVQLPVTVPSFDGDTTGNRLGHLLDAAAYPTSARSIDAGRSVLAATTFGDTTISLIGKTEKTEYGTAFISPSGKFVFYDRYKASTATRSTTIQATFTDAGGLSGLELSKGIDRLVNDVHITRDPIPSLPTPAGEDAADQPVEQVATDLASQSKYGTRSLPVQVGQLARDDWQALAMAQWLAPRYANATVRISQVTIKGLGFDQWTELLGLMILDRIRVQRTYAGFSLDVQLLVRGVGMDIQLDPPSWDFAFSTDLPPPGERATKLVLGGTVGLGAASLSF